MEEIAVLYSGGTDSTCAAALMLREFDRVRLLTYRRFGLFSINNIKKNVTLLKEKFGKNKITHTVIKFDMLFKYLSYSNYFHYLKRYNFFLLSTCGLCKLSMHIRTLIYCLENNIKYVCDGSTRYSGNNYYPAQMTKVLDEIKAMYKQYNIEFLTPVYDFDEPDNIEWFDKLGLRKIRILNLNNGQGRVNKTAGEVLFDMKIFSQKNVKGTIFDKKMQARCFQLILFNLFLYWYYLPIYGEQKYIDTAHKFFKEKIKDSNSFVEKYLENIKNVNNIIEE